MMIWTQFWDTHSGGGCKEPPYEKIYIEAPEDEAKVIFYNRFGHNPERVTCTCCGGDYSISESVSLEQASGYHRKCDSLETPRDEDGRFRRPDDPWFEEHYWLDPEDVGEAVRRGYKVRLSAEKEGFQRHPDPFSDGSRFDPRVIPVAEYETQEDVLVVRAAEIKPEERTGSVPDEGYVWAEGRE